MTSSILPVAGILLVSSLLASVASANGTPKPVPQTSTGRELTGPGAQHGEYIVPDSLRESTPDTMRDGRDSSRGKPLPETPKAHSDKPPTGDPTPGVDDKSSTRPGE
jgi:hypothetical protein